MLKYIILDVDGTLTDGGIYYDDNNNELKKFCTKDGTGKIIARAAGLKILVITGHECKATTRRLTELGVTDIYQNVKDKVSFLKQWIADNNVDKSEIAYIGDDINDLGAMKLCGYIGCPLDSAVEIKDLATYVSSIPGGRGAARDVIEHYFREQGTWLDLVDKAYGAGT